MKEKVRRKSSKEETQPDFFSTSFNFSLSSSFSLSDEVATVEKEEEKGPVERK